MKSFDKIPFEMQTLNQWVVCGMDKIPYTLDFRGQFVKAKSTNITTLLSFQQAVQLANKFDIFIGYVLAESDAFTCIDLDIKDHTSRDKNGIQPSESKWTTVEEIERFKSIVDTFKSYTETSMSGRGLHIWVKANIGEGRRRDGIEVYSQERFIVCTGQPIQNPEYEWSESKGWFISKGLNVAAPLIDCQEKLDFMTSQMLAASQGRATKEQLVEIEQSYTDDQIWDMGTKAENSDKFIALCQGKWSDLNYPSQSEADLSLMSMFTFYSKSNSQCKRLFRCTGLGTREKAVKNDRYLNFTLNLIRHRQKEEDATARHLIEMLQANKPDATYEPPVSTVKSVIKPSAIQNSLASMAKHQKLKSESDKFEKNRIEKLDIIIKTFKEAQQNCNNFKGINSFNLEHDELIYDNVYLHYASI